MSGWVKGGRSEWVGKGRKECMGLAFKQCLLSRNFYLLVGVVPVKGGATKEEEKKEMEALLRSDFWKTLLRGGYQVGKLTRSLSGAHVCYDYHDSAYHVTIICDLLGDQSN